MKIINSTNWRTRDLKKLFTAALRRNIKVEGQLTVANRLTITVVSGSHSGNATLWGRTMRLRIPPCPYSLSCYLICPKQLDPVKVAALFDHELQHNRGYGHKGTLRRRGLPVEHYEWAKAFEIRQKELKAKPKMDLQLKRYAHVLHMVKDKQAKLKRVQGQLKKWTQKKRYYEKALLAAGKIET